MLLKIKILLPVMLSVFVAAEAQYSGGDSIPVRISYMDGERIGSHNQVNWAVACFLQYALFEVQRSHDGATFHTIHTFQADELRCRQPFSYTDIQQGERSFYRIKVGDVNGRFYSSKTIALYGKTKGFDITGISPTITTGQLTMRLSSSSPDKVELLVLSVSGTVVKRTSYNIERGNNSITLLLNTLEKGLYFIAILNSEGEKRTRAVIKD
jgi:hypothetical protein